ncbi:MAG TPA: putative Ig domain-containing protein, partial [Haliangiales bacterium]|nr:putative Ig domain-containing protein [Haliangiales bacterium]
YTIPPGGFLLVWADDDTGQNTTNTPDLHVDFKLSQSGEGIWFFAPNGTNVDGVTFGPQTSDVSQGRWPDGNSGQYYFMLRPTPAAPNVLGTATNQPPVLAPIGDKTINEGSALIFTASATDPDNGQTLTYSLDAGAPAGASINASSGVFLWTPAEFHGPGNYPVNIRVTDNGSPQLSDTETIAITVNEVNAAPSLTFIDDQFVNQGSTLTFSVFANDPDVPANTLTFSLDPGAPAGASINPSTGLFTWTTAANQAPGATPLTVRVTDNGAPPLGDAQSFDITVNASTELKLTGVGMSNDVMTLRWTSQPGKTYRLEYKDDLDQTNWNALGDFNANDGTLSATNNVNGAPQRYYRVRQLN